MEVRKGVLQLLLATITIHVHLQTLQLKLHHITDHVLQALQRVHQALVHTADLQIALHQILIADLQTARIVAHHPVLTQPIAILPEVAPVLQVKAVVLPIQAVLVEEAILAAATLAVHEVVATLEEAAPAALHQGDNK